MSRKKSKFINKTSSVIDYIKEIKGFETDAELAKAMKIKQNTISTWRAKNSFPIKKLINYCDKEKISLIKLMVPELTDTVLYNRKGLILPVGDNNVGYDVDEFGRAVAGLKEIFDSRDPVLIPAIQANIHAFQISVRREFQVQQQSDEITALKKENTSIKTRIEVIEKRLAGKSKDENTEKKAM